jgi:hypothetical protein
MVATAGARAFRRALALQRMARATAEKVEISFIEKIMSTDENHNLLREIAAALKSIARELHLMRTRGQLYEPAKPEDFDAIPPRK